MIRIHAPHRSRKLVLALALLLATGSAAAARAARGHLVLVGGGDKPPEAMAKFVELAGGADAPIVVVPTASRGPDTIPYYVDLFHGLGVRDVVGVDVRSPADARRPDVVAAIERARGVFFAGGDQVWILTAFRGSPALDAIRRLYFERGGVVGGTSAGTACQTPIMITGEGDFGTVRARAVETWDGLGLWPGVIVDQHFLARQRFNRLLSVVLEHPAELGVAVDEDTAVWVKPDGTFEVMGRHQVMVIDAAGAAIARRDDGSGRDLLGVHDLRVQLLLAGERYDVVNRKVLPAVAEAPALPTATADGN